MEEPEVPVTCPVCGRKNFFPRHELSEGAVIACPACKLRLTLQCHLWEEIRAEIEKIEKQQG